MLAEVDPLPVVKDLRFNIASSHDHFTRGPAKLKIDTPMPKLAQFYRFLTFKHRSILKFKLHLGLPFPKFPLM